MIAALLGLEFVSDLGGLFFLAFVAGVFADVAARVTGRGPQKFTTFGERLLGDKFMSGQLAFCMTAFEGVQPDKLPRSIRDVGARIWGGIVGAIDAAAVVIVVLVAGRASGKTVIGLLRVLHLGLTMRLPAKLLEPAVGILVAPNHRQSLRNMQVLAALIHRDPVISAMVLSENADEIILRRPSGHVLRFVAIPAGRAGGAIRGETIFAAHVDETAQFRSEGADVSDVETVNAITPRLLPGGQIIISGTPLGETGLLFELHHDNFGKPSTALVCHAATIDMRDDKLTRAMVEREKKRNARNYAREFLAQFFGADTALLTRPEIQACMTPGVKRRAARPGGDYRLIHDRAVKRDNCVSLVFHVETKFENEDSGSSIVKVVIDDFDILSPKQLGRPLTQAEIDRQILHLVKRYGVKQAYGDQKDLADFQKLGVEHGFEVAELPTHPKAQHQRAEQFVQRVVSGAIDLLDRPEIEKEVVDARMQIRPGGHIVAHAKAGATDDLLDCILAACDPEIVKTMRSTGEIRKVTAVGAFMDPNGVLHTRSKWIQEMPDGTERVVEPPMGSVDFEMQVVKLLGEGLMTARGERYLRGEAQSRGLDPAQFIAEALRTGGANLAGVNARVRH